MAIVPGTLNKWTYTFAGGTVVIYAANQEQADILLGHQNLVAEDNGSREHTTAKTKHSTLGALTGITRP